VSIDLEVWHGLYSQTRVMYPMAIRLVHGEPLDIGSDLMFH